MVVELPFLRLASVGYIPAEVFVGYHPVVVVRLFVSYHVPVSSGCALVVLL